MITLISVLLGLLQIIGWVLLIVFCLIVLILLVILFIPIRYEIRAAADDEMKLDIHVKWFFKLFYYHYFFHKEKQTTGIMKFFGKTLFREEIIFQKKKIDEHQNDTTVHKGTKQNLKKDSLSESKNSIKEKKLEQNMKVVQESNENKISKNNGHHDAVIKEKETANELIKAKKNVKRKATGLEQEVEEQVKEKDSFGLKDFWEYPYKKEIIYHTYLLVKRFIRHILPDIFKAEGEVGMEDPAITGYIVGVFSIFSAFFGKDVHIVGNFQQKVLNGSLYARGKIYLGTIVKIIIMYIWEKPIRKIIKQYLRNRKDEAYGE